MGDVGTLVANAAFSLTLSGNSGISPFLTMFLIGWAGRLAPDHLYLEETMDKLMTSWPSLCFWTVAAILEGVGKCVPVVDEIMDSAEAFIVPVLSTLGSFSAFGSFESVSDAADAASGNEYNNAGRKLRGLSTESTSSVKGHITAFFRVILVFVGAILALSIHFCKMLIRLLGEGCLTQLITVLETTTVCFSVLVSIFVRQFAIFVAGCLILLAGYGAKRRYEKWHEKKDEGNRHALEMQGQRHHGAGNVEEGNTNENGAAPSSDYQKMDEADAFVHMLTPWRK